MNEKKPVRSLIGVLCVAILLAVVSAALVLDSRSPDPIVGIFRPEWVNNKQDDPAQNPDSQPESPDTPSSTVEIPPSAEAGETMALSFPFRLPGYGLVIEKLVPFSGAFVEDGSNAKVENVAMLLVHNNGDYPVEYTQIRVAYGQETLLFDISALPVGERLVVQEKDGKAIPAGTATSATATVVQRAEMELSEGKILVTDNGDNTLTIQNLTDELIPTVRVFYKYYMGDESLFVGGIAFAVRIARLAANASITVQPAHYTSQASRVVMALAYDSEV